MDAPRNAANAPVLIVLHGGIAGARSIRRRAQVGLAREGWIVLWPSAVDDWKDGRTDRFGRPYDDADDVGFLRALIQSLAASGAADPSRVFVAGPSIGGVMALKLVCDAPDLVAGAAVAIASLPEGQREVFLLNRMDQMTYKEIAEFLGVSQKAVEKRMHKALVKLRKTIKNI